MTEKPDAAYRKVLDLVGRDAILARGMVEAYVDHNMSKLRDCQKYAADLANEFGAKIDTTQTNRTSQVGRMLRDAGVFMQFGKKTTKGYVLEEGPRLYDFADFLEENDNYGRFIEKKPEPLRERMELLQHLEEFGCVRANSVTNKIPQKVYSLLSEKLKAGELDVIYVYKGAVAAVKHSGETIRAEYYVD